MTPDEMFARLGNPRIDAFLDEGIARVKVAAEDKWPSDKHPENIWQTGRSVRQFSTSGSGDSRTLTNDADYSGYTEGGFTIKGGKTAKPWAARGAVPYLEQVANEHAEAEAGLLLAHITED